VGVCLTEEDNLEFSGDFSVASLDVPSALPYPGFILPKTEPGWLFHIYVVLY